MCEFISQSDTYVPWNSPLTVYLRYLGRATFHRIEAYPDKGIIISSKVERSFHRTFLMCESISYSYTYVSWNSPFTLSLSYLRRATLDRLEDSADKGNIISSKRKRSFLRSFFVTSEFISQSYKLVLMKQFGKNLFVESA